MFRDLPTARLAVRELGRLLDAVSALAESRRERLPISTRASRARAVDAAAARLAELLAGRYGREEGDQAAG